MNKLSKLVLLTLLTIIANITFANAENFTFHLHGQSYDCNTNYALKVGTRDNCEINCPNRVYIFQDRTCRLRIGASEPFPSSDDTSVSMSNCTLAEGEENTANDSTTETHFIGLSGKCYPCASAEAVAISAEDCNETRFCNQNCPQRIRKHYNTSTNLYSVLKCPSNKPLMDRFMMCWSCSEKTPIDLSFDKSFNNICEDKRRMAIEISDETPPIPHHLPYSYLK